MSFGQFGGFIVDTCVLLPQPLESMIKSSSTFLKEAASECILLSSVKKEALDLIEKAHDIVVSYIHNNLKAYLDGKGIKELSNRDGKILADFFSEQRVQLKKLPYKRSNIQSEILGAIENYVASQLHSLKNGQNLPINVFLPAVAAELAVTKHTLEAPFRGLRYIDIQPKNSIISAIVIGAMIKNSNDALHLASALEYQFQCNKWVIFVTTDQEDILSKEKELREMFLQCSRPEWALDYKREITKNKAPLEYARDIKSLTANQRSILSAIGKLKI